MSNLFRYIEQSVQKDMDGFYSALGVCRHEFYQTGDADIPKQIMDRNGEVVLQMCKKCGKCEAELNLSKIQSFIDEYIDEYEMYVEYDDGTEGFASPTDFQKQLMKDAILGLLNTAEFIKLIKG